MTTPSPLPLTQWTTIATAMVGAILGVMNFGLSWWERRPYIVYAPSSTDPLTSVFIQIHNPSRRHLQVVKVTSRRNDTEIKLRIKREKFSFQRDVEDALMADLGAFFVYVEPRGSRTVEAFQIQRGERVVFRLHWHRHDWRRFVSWMPSFQMRCVVNASTLEQLAS